MQQDPAYLQNQSRRLHALYRRNRRFMNWVVVIWAAFFFFRFAAALVDRLFDLGWGYAAVDVWASAGFVAFAGAFWVFASLIQKLNLAYIRHTYGPDPSNDRSALSQEAVGIVR